MGDFFKKRVQKRATLDGLGRLLPVGPQTSMDFIIFFLKTDLKSLDLQGQFSPEKALSKPPNSLHLQLSDDLIMDPHFQQRPPPEAEPAPRHSLLWHFRCGRLRPRASCSFALQVSMSRRRAFCISLGFAAEGFAMFLLKRVEVLEG